MYLLLTLDIVLTRIFCLVPGVGLTPTDAPSKDYLGKALAVARKSTASIGKFTDKLPTEKASKYTGKKRKVANVFYTLLHVISETSFYAPLRRRRAYCFALVSRLVGQ
jgi:hypothetical protein